MDKMTITAFMSGIKNWVLGKIQLITSLIPSQASSSNQLADKAFVNSSIATATATYRGNYNVVTDLSLSVSATHAQIQSALAAKMTALSIDVDNNDYAFVQIPTADATPTQIAKIEKYKYNGSAWLFEYELNNSGFTAAQWAAINSGATLDLIGKLSALPTNAELTALLDGKQNVIADLATIRSGATAGASAVQPNTLAAALVQTVAEAGVFDVTANNDGATFDDLEDLLSDEDLATLIPEAVRAGGMSIKFVNTSDNKYHQFKLTTKDWNTNIIYWIEENVYYAHSIEYIYTITDNSDRVLCGILKDGDFYFALGCPKQIRAYVEEKVLSKVDKEEGKSLIDELFSESISSESNFEFASLKLINDRIAFGIRKNGSAYIPFVDAIKIVSDLLSGKELKLEKSLQLGNDVISTDVLRNNAPSITSSSYQSIVTTLDSYVPTIIERSSFTPDEIISIESQADFDDINNAIQDAIDNGKTKIVVLLKPQELTFNENHIDNSEYENCEGVDIAIVGNNTIIKGKGSDFVSSLAESSTNTHNSYLYPYSFNSLNTYLDNGKDVDLLGSVLKVNALPVKTNDTGKICTLQLDNRIKNVKVGSWLLIASGYVKEFAKITAYDDVNNIITLESIGYNLAREVDYGIPYQRFNLLFGKDNINFDEQNNKINIPIKYSSLYECRACTFINLTQTFNSFSLSGVHFIGNGVLLKDESGEIGTIKNKSLLHIEDCDTVNIYDCRFENIKSEVMNYDNSTNILVENNIFAKCLCRCVFVNNNCDYVNIVGNDFEQSSLYGQAFNVCCQANHHYIANNKHLNYFTQAISVGVEPNSEQDMEGVTENNIILQTQEISVGDYGAADIGAVYVYKSNTNLIIRDNIIIGVDGVGVMGNGSINVSGIYCDDGAKGFSIYRNLIIGSNFCRAIYARKRELYSYSNTNNFIGFNILSGYYFFEGKYLGNSDADNCIQARNYILKNNQFTRLANLQVSNVKEKEDDIVIPQCQINDNSVFVPLTYKDVLMPVFNKNTNIYNYIKFNI